MPAAVVAVAAAWGGATIAAAIGLTGVMAAVVGSVIAMGLSSIGTSILGLNNKPNQPSSVGQESSLLLQNDASPIASIPVIYGRRRVGVSRVFLKVTDNNQYLHLVLALCEGGIEAVEKVYFNGEEAWNPEDGIKSKFDGVAWINAHLGADDQAADSDLVTAMGDANVWGSDHRLRGTAYLYVKLKYDRNIFQGVPTIQADIAGIKTYERFEQDTAEAPNPKITLADGSASSPRVLYHYLVNSRYGKGIDPTMIDGVSFQDAQDYCDNNPVYYYASQADQDSETATELPGGRYECNIGIDPDTAVFENVKKILTSMNAMLTFSGGKYRLIVNKLEEPSFDFNADNIIGRWDIALPNRSTKFNRLKVNWPDAGQGFQPTITYIESEDYKNEDGNELLEQNIDLPGTTDHTRAYLTGYINLAQSRHTTVCSFTATYNAFNVAVGDVVTITHDTPGWSGKTFRVMGLGLLSDGTARVTLAEYDENIYAIGFEGRPVPFKADPATLDVGYATTVLPPTNLIPITEWIQDTAGSTKGYINVYWDTPDSSSSGTIAYYVVQYKIVDTDNWISVSTPTNYAKLGPLAAGYTYDIRVYSVNQFGARSSYLV